MRFFRRGQNNRATGIYPSSLHAVWYVMHWPKRKQLMQKAHWTHGLGMAAWIWQVFSLSLCLEPCHTSASTSGLTGKICDHAGEPVDIWLISVWFFQNWSCISHLKVYFVDLYAMETSAASGGLPSGLGSFDAGGITTRKPLKFCNSFLNFFSIFYFLLVFQKGKQRVYWANKQKDQ